MDKKFTVGVIRVLTSDDPEFVGMHGRFIEEHYPGIRCVSKCIPDQPEGIHSHELERIAVPKVVETAKSFEDVDMIIVSCADDPGVPEVRKALPGIPVTGGGETTAALALRYGEKIAVLGIVDYAPKAYLRMIPPEKLVAVGRPEGVNSTLDLMTPEGRESCFRKARELTAAAAPRHVRTPYPRQLMKPRWPNRKPLTARRLKSVAPSHPAGPGSQSVTRILCRLSRAAVFVAAFMGVVYALLRGKAIVNFDKICPRQGGGPYVTMGKIIEERGGGGREELG